ncbi:MAG: NADH:flavin oxidoreductase [Chloroflexi bacterium]|nr:NADH:flavin oxidoreductase [Chloroflexota bacterium]
MPGLLDPVRIKSLELPNRLVMPPMANLFATEDGEVTERLLSHYRERAPGVGLVIVEHSYVMPAGRARVHQTGVHSDAVIPGLTLLAETVHELGAKIAIQLNHAGAKAWADPALGAPAGPSAVTAPNSRIVPRELSVGEIREVVVAFGKAAVRTVEAGFDAVELHGAHGFLVNQFTSPLTNRRSDRYGGSLENRMRLALEIVAEVRSRVGSGYPVLFRLGADDMMDGGLTVEEGQRIAVALVKAGVDVIDVSGGHRGSQDIGFTGQGYLIPLAEKIKKVVAVPVIGVGGITEPEFADQVIREGRVDLVAVGRAILHNPGWARQATAILTPAR